MTLIPIFARFAVQKFLGCCQILVVLLVLCIHRTTHDWRKPSESVPCNQRNRPKTLGLPKMAMGPSGLQASQEEASKAHKVLSDSQQCILRSSVICWGSGKRHWDVESQEASSQSHAPLTQLRKLEGGRPGFPYAAGMTSISARWHACKDWGGT